MKKFLLAVAATAALAFASTAGAEQVCTDVGCASVNEGGYVLVADGAAGNPDPVDGYIAITESNGCASDQGSPDDQDGDGIPDSEDEDNGGNAPTCGP